VPDVPQFAGDYIVGWKLRLIMRIEEWSNVSVPVGSGGLAAHPIQPPQARMRGVASGSSQSIPQKQPETPSSPGGYAVTFVGGQTIPPGGPQAVDGSQDGLTYTIGAVIPRSFKLSLNGFKEPDTMTCDLRFVDVPFDPLVFRSVGVELYVGTITQDDYTAGISGATRDQASADTSQDAGEPLNVVPDSFVGPSGELRSNLRFQGFVDEWETELTDESLAVVHFKCSDNTRVLIDTPMSPGARLSSTLPVDQAVAQFLAQWPQFAGLTVQYRPASLGTIPTLGPVFADSSQMPDGLQASQGGAKQTLSVWDYLVELMTCIGHNIRVETYAGSPVIVIQRIRAALGKNFPPRDGDPFTGRTWDGSNHPLRTFIWGRNCKVVKKQRKYSRAGSINVEVRCYNPLTKSTMLARFPPFANSAGLGGQAANPNASTNRLVHALPGDGRIDTKYTIYPVAGVTDQTTLQNIAQAYYEGLNRAELGLTIQTKDLASYGGDNSDPDILDMFAGDHFEFLTERFDDSTAVSTDVGDIENAMLQGNLNDPSLFNGFDSAFVSAYLAAYSMDAYQTTFVAKRIDVTGSVEDEEGISIHIEGANMVEARCDAPGVADFADAQLGAQGTAAPTGRTPPAGGP
jgi:hypothetical protein